MLRVISFCHFLHRYNSMYFFCMSYISHCLHFILYCWKLVPRVKLQLNKICGLWDATLVKQLRPEKRTKGKTKAKKTILNEKILRWNRECEIPENNHHFVQNHKVTLARDCPHLSSFSSAYKLERWDCRKIINIWLYSYRFAFGSIALYLMHMMGY